MLTTTGLTAIAFGVAGLALAHAAVGHLAQRATGRQKEAFYLGRYYERGCCPSPDSHALSRPPVLVRRSLAG